MDKTVILVLLLASVGFAQKPAKTATVADENAILKAEHDLDQANLTKQAAQSQFLQLKAAFEDADKKANAAQKSLTDAIEAAWKTSGLSKDEYNFDPANFTFIAKPKQEAKK